MTTMTIDTEVRAEMCDMATELAADQDATEAVMAETRVLAAWLESAADLADQRARLLALRRQLRNSRQARREARAAGWPATTAGELIEAAGEFYRFFAEGRTA